MSVQADRFESFQKKMSFFSKSSVIFFDVIGGPSPIIRFLQKINTLNKTKHKQVRNESGALFEKAIRKNLGKKVY